MFFYPVYTLGEKKLRFFSMGNFLYEKNVHLLISMVYGEGMKVGIFANPTKSDAPEALKMMVAELGKYGIECVLDIEAGELLGEEGTEAFHKGVDLVLSLGGDGTMLETVHRLEEEIDTPLAGINIGTLGFLTTCTDEEFPQFAKLLAEGSLKTEDLTMLKVNMSEEGNGEHTFYALNEVVLMRGNTGRLVSIQASVNGDFLTHYKADGLIISTPTGSTAYSLAAGGPLITPGSGVFVVNPICPHTLSNRALVLPNDSVMELRACDDIREPILFTADGRDVIKLAPESVVTVTKASKPLQLLKMPQASYYEKLRVKLGWAGGMSKTSC